MRPIVWIAGVGLLASLAAPAAFGQIAADPLLPTGTLTLPSGAYSKMPDDSQRVYGFYIGAEGSLQSRPTSSDPRTIKEDVAALAADIARDSIVLSAGYERTRLSIAETSTQPGSLSVTQELLFLGLSSLVAGTFNLAATFGQVYYRSSAEFPNVSGSADMAYPDVTVGFSVNVAPQWRIGANLSPAIAVSSHFDGSLAQFQVVQKTGHGDQVRLGLSRNTRSSTVGIDGYYYEENLGSDSPRTQGWLLHGAHLFGSVLVRAEYEYIDEAKVVDGTRFVSPPTVTQDLALGLFWGVQTWVVGARAAQNSQTSSDYGNATEDAKRNETTTVNVFLLSVLKQF
jgi:hypothetical protein